MEMMKKNKKEWSGKKKKKQEQSLVVLDPLQSYINKVKLYPELTSEEEFALAVKYRNEGDSEAAYKLVTANLMLVVKIAMKFKREFQNLLDLVQEGNVGLMQAVKKFDPIRGVRLPAYASWWIRAYILKYILDNWRLVKVGTTNVRRKLLYNLQKEKDKLLTAGFSPTPKLLAAHFDVSPEEIIDVDMSLGASDVSLDAPIGEGSNSTLQDILDDNGVSVEEEVLRKHLYADLRESISSFQVSLKESDKDILQNRIMAVKPDTLQDIADRFGVTKEAIRQAEKRLLDRLKDFIKNKYPDIVNVGEGCH